MTNSINDSLRYNGLKIKEGDKITFQYNGAIYTKKVQIVFIQSSNGITVYNVNPIGSGTGWVGIYPEEVLNIKKSN
tara:strand:+ start:5929 stop:6156 length:228 start_codon:yes stop_codon:yes gene_type:complete